MPASLHPRDSGETRYARRIGKMARIIMVLNPIRSFAKRGSLKIHPGRKGREFIDLWGVRDFAGGGIVPGGGYWLWLMPEWRNKVRRQDDGWGVSRSSAR
jgi:hypothetical protein